MCGLTTNKLFNLERHLSNHIYKKKKNEICKVEGCGFSASKSNIKKHQNDIHKGTVTDKKGKSILVIVLVLRKYINK